MSNSNESESAIAIIGMSGRFPGARNLDEFWQNLRDGVESISFFTKEEMAACGTSPEYFNHPDYVAAKGILQEPELWDAPFFGFNPTEAAVLDPQQRLFMECAWEAIEVAGYEPETYDGLIGLFAGASVSNYMLNLYRNPQVQVDFYTLGIANNNDHLPTRTSYKLNLKGPSVAVQTSCSTSLVAVHMACQSLLSYQCDMALAGGAAISVPLKAGYIYFEGGIDSPDGHCKAFDARANGTIGGSGVGCVLLKRLANAIADNDTIHAVILGSAINNDGSLKVGYTAPSVDGQAAVITMAQAVAEVEPDSIGYVETHGTGTFLGDPIEMSALTQAFRDGTERKGYCAIGSVKTNIGHADAAAGIAGLLKTVLALKHGMIPPSLHFESPNPQIDFANSPFFVNNELREWKTEDSPRRAGVSSFGIGGTNAHVILEEAPEIESSDEPARPAQLMLLSARTEAALDNATANLAAHFKNNPAINLTGAAYTLQIGRRHFKHRRMLVCGDVNEAAHALETRDPKRIFTSVAAKEQRPVTFMFPGQGSQYVNMGRELYETEPAFAAQIDRCAELLEPHLGIDLRTLLYPSPETAADAAESLNQTEFTQPAVFVVEYALARLWMQWGVQPETMIGHSIGEYVAACLSEVFSLEDALMLVAARGRMMQHLPGGSMLAVQLEEKQLQQELLSKRISIAAVNSPALCVLSGPTAEIEELQQQLEAKNVVCKRLRTSNAFHSAMMDPILEPFLAFLSKIKLSPPRIPFVSNLTGNFISAAEATDRAYWAKHLRHTVRFADGLQRLMSDPARILLEVGPGRTLSSTLPHYAEKPDSQLALCSLRHPHQSLSDTEFLLHGVGRLWLAGIRINWQEFHSGSQHRRVTLPTYPFERKRHWIDAPPRNTQVIKNEIEVAAPDLLERTLSQQIQIMTAQLAQQERVLNEQLKLLIN